jgi:hypothetical protein
MSGTRTTPEVRTTGSMVAAAAEDKEEEDDVLAVARTGPEGENGLNGAPAAGTSALPTLFSRVLRFPTGKISDVRRS